MATYFAQRATAGLIVTNGVCPSLQGKANPGTPGLAGEDHIESWRQVATAVHANGGRIFAHLMHADGSGSLRPAARSRWGRCRSRFVHDGLLLVGAAAGPGTARTLDHGSSPGGDRVYGGGSPRHRRWFRRCRAPRRERLPHQPVSLHQREPQVGLLRRFGLGSHPVRSRGGCGSGWQSVGPRVGIRLSPGAGIWDAGEEDVPFLFQAPLTELPGSIWPTCT